jgi:hypothetical protein
MNVYTLRFVESDAGQPERLKFRAPDTVSTLVIAHEEASRRSAELWDEAKRLCTIHRRPGQTNPLKATRV